MQYTRHRLIVERLRASQTLTVAQLRGLTGASAATVRRDLDALEGLGLLRRVRGGAVATDEPVADADAARPFDAVAAGDPARKRRIARAAAARVEDGQTVILDIGTTTMHLARALRGRRVTVVTANLAVVDALREDRDVELVLLGGTLRRSYHSFVGALTDHAIRQVRADWVFLGASGVTREGTVLDTTQVEVPVKRALVTAGERVVLLADGDKLPGRGTFQVCGPEALDLVVTDAGADPRMVEALRAAGCAVETV
ncbi:DeoR/GlpR transcriptional regulator [Phycicoccus endophyticus]|uniref:DeoR/GlpR transcriptional regulator n=1 Tax=Phycicoccus endophyticus TaxID=1690220 RepID=A0A7G9QYP2_9MICO|nr:DeoR/GlpR family DNA-binding transcription regulator [Phycicoccus endophyticus]NHI20497.1 DeoR/GlpR transcriptional regulator [Phycicoccus endophyticus]QNN48467.1 DeoR/GlpR transcriptional regulator [Phycicoccus endophyticus]GGL30262.1 DeoR family transcriptional regulator [Phycicoccus endophyticus]